MKAILIALLSIIFSLFTGFTYLVFGDNTQEHVPAPNPSPIPPVPIYTPTFPTIR